MTAVGIPHPAESIPKSMKTIVIEQMELGMNGQGARGVRQERLSRARWWFGKMRQVVDLALPAQPLKARPEQIYFELAPRARR